MSIIPFNRNRPNPQHLLAESMNAIKDKEFDEVIVILMNGDKDLVNWSEMPMSNLCYAAALLNKIVSERMSTENCT